LRKKVVLIAVLCVALARPARAETLDAARDQIVIGIVAVGAGIGVLVTLLVLHAKHQKRTITGCVGNGMSVMDEKDKRTYALAGDTAGVKPGNRMALEGKPKETSKTLVLEVHKITADLGACQQPATGSL
jgi:hypothetical protein